MRQRQPNIVWTVALSTFLATGPALAANVENFLTKVSDSGKAEIAFGLMAVDRAENPKVKQFGQRMIEDHQKAGMEVKQLALKQGIDLPLSMLLEQKEQTAKFSQLSGKEFDRAYMRYMLKEHAKDVTEFEKSEQTLSDPATKNWVAVTLPQLKEHLTIARNIAADLGIQSP